jgi:hypothetical protein
VAAAEATAEGVAQPSSTVPPPVASRPSLSFPGSMLRVIAENQAGEVDSFNHVTSVLAHTEVGSVVQSGK